ncbi:MAG: hypothetical protein MZV49_23235 [Rhodopseudomonas palustris]|nr:hypothetical protein [Rhodopseudomonas palustris]
MTTLAALDIAYQTLYSELVQRSLDDSFTSEFSTDGRFVAVKVKTRQYWYFDSPNPEGVHSADDMSVPWTIPKSPNASKPSRTLRRI